MYAVDAHESPVRRVPLPAFAVQGHSFVLGEAFGDTGGDNSPRMAMPRVFSAAADALELPLTPPYATSKAPLCWMVVRVTSGV